jgi:cell division protein FtsZ
MRFELEDEKRLTVLRVVGIGGAGGNAVNRMVGSDFKGVDFVAINTDLQVLRESKAYEKIQIGEDLTRGLGSGGDADVGRQSAEESLEIVSSCVQGADMVFLTAGMGGGTGTGASPVVAQVARASGSLTVGIVTKPFSFEGTPRMRQANSGIDELKEAVDTLIVIPNDKLLETADDDTTMLDAFAEADKVLCNATRGISDLITETGVVNLDFADVKSVMKDGGNALMGTGVGSGVNAAEDAARAAISSPLLGDVSIRGASGILVNVTGSKSLGIKQISKAAAVINGEAGNDAHVFLGTVINESLPDDEVRITVIATGFEKVRSALHESERSSQVVESAESILVAQHNNVETVVFAEPAVQKPQTPAAATGDRFSVAPDVSQTVASREEPVVPEPEAAGMVRETPPPAAATNESVAPRVSNEPRGETREINFAEMLERDQSVIQLPPQPDPKFSVGSDAGRQPDAGFSVGSDAGRQPDAGFSVGSDAGRQPDAEWRPRRTPEPASEESNETRGEEEKKETILMDNGSIRSFNSDKFRVPTFVRKQID